MTGDARLPPVGQEGRLHVTGRSVPVAVHDHVRESVTLNVTEEGWSLTDGEARLVYTGPEGAVIIAGAVRVRPDGLLFFTPGRLTQELTDHVAQETVAQRGRGVTPDVGQRRETFRVDLLLDVVVLVDERELAAQTINLSPTGCLLRGDARPLVDAIVAVRIPIDERVVQLQARVIRVEAERYALHFREMDAAQERAVSGLIAKRQREILRRR